MVRTNTRKIIREHFFQNPSSKLRVRQIERKLDLSLPSVIRYCEELEEERILKTVETSGVIFYTADRGSDKFLFEKKVFNLKQIRKSGVTKYLKEKLHNPTIILFGSYSKGEDTEESDVDLYVETLSKEKVELKKFEKLLQRRIQLFRHENIKEITNPHLANNVINGITLNGFLEVFS